MIKSSIGRLRIIGFLEGISLLILVFVAVPLKYGFDDARLSKLLGPMHGAIFLLFLFTTLSVAVEHKWKFRDTTWKVILACFIPFGTFYIDRIILRKFRYSFKSYLQNTPQKDTSWKINPGSPT